MKSIQINKYGGSDVVYTKDDVPMPKVSAGKVLVEVRAPGVTQLTGKSVKDTCSKWRHFNSR